MTVTLACCLLAAFLAVIGQASDVTPWTAYFATAVLVVGTALVGYAVWRVLGQSDEDDDEDAR